MWRGNFEKSWKQRKGQKKINKKESREFNNDRRKVSVGDKVKKGRRYGGGREKRRNGGWEQRRLRDD